MTRSRQHRPQHVLALGHRPCRHRRGADAAGDSGRQEPIQLAGKAFGRKRAGDRRAAPGPPIGGGDPHAAQGRHRSAGAAEVDRASRASRRRAGCARSGSASPATRSGRCGWLRRAREVVRESGDVTWTTNALGLAPNLASPIQLMRGPGLRAIIAADRGMLVGEISDRNRKIWVLSDPDVISNHGLAREGNAALAVAIIKRLRSRRRQRRVRRDRARLCRQAGEPVPAAVPLSVRGRDRSRG